MRMYTDPDYKMAVAGTRRKSTEGENLRKKEECSLRRKVWRRHVPLRSPAKQRYNFSRQPQGKWESWPKPDGAADG